MKNFYQPLISTLMVVVALTFSIQVQAQDKTVSGQVTGADNGEGLPGVNILIKGTNTGSVSDFDGNYTLSTPDGAVLLFSFIGYVSQEVTVGTQSSIDVVLEADITTLSEIVVI